MKVYFLSSTPCQLTVNGAYFGITDTFERYAELSLTDNLFLCFTPQNGQAISFFLNENIRFQPPNGCEVYLLRDCILLYAKRFPPSDTRLKVIAQKRFDDTLITVVKQGETQVYIQTERDFFTASLPFDCSSCEITAAGGAYLLFNGDTLYIFTATAEPLFCRRVLSFAVENDRLSVRLPLFDSQNRVAECTYILSPTQCQQTQFTILDSPYLPDEETLAYVFFESLLIGANIEEFLSDELRTQTERLRAFLGDFVSVARTESPNTCILIRKKKDNLFEGDYFTVEIENGKIANVTG